MKFKLELESDDAARERYRSKHSEATGVRDEYFTRKSQTEKGFDAVNANVIRWGSDNVRAVRRLVIGNRRVDLPSFLGKRVRN